MKKRWTTGNDRKRFRLETTLPPAVAMERIQALTSMSKRTGQSYLETYRISHEQLDGTIYFELRMMTQYELMPSTLSRIVNGQIYELEPSRTLVEGEVVTPPRVRALWIALVTIVGTATIVLYLTGAMPESDFLQIVGVVIVGAILYRVFSSGKHGRQPIIQTIEMRIQSRAKDQHSGALRLPDQESAANSFAEVVAESVPIKEDQGDG